MIKITKEKIAVYVAVIGIFFLTIGFTAALFNYIGQGTKENAISSDSITFLYEEIDKQGAGISITNAVPIEDSDGKQGQAFNFEITAKTANSITIPYEIAVRQKPGTDDLGDIVKLYLTKVDSTGNETQVALGTYNSFTTVEYYGHEQKRLLQQTVPQSTNDYLQKYRLRMWIDKDANFSGGNYNEKTFAVTVNVYSTGQLVTSSSQGGNTLAEMILADNQVQTRDPIAEKYAASHSSSSGGSGAYGNYGGSSSVTVEPAYGLYESTNTNSGDPTYYFAGGVENNYVLFADQTWRAVRINEDGTVRLMLDRNIDTRDNYTYDQANTVLQSWYQTNIASNSTYSDLIADSGNYFCESFNLREKYYYDTSNLDTQAVTEEYPETSFRCEQDFNNKQYINSNIGSLSVNEATNSLGGATDSGAVHGYGSYWLSTPAGYSYDATEAAWSVNDSGLINSKCADCTGNGLRPVINLKASTTATRAENGVYVVDDGVAVDTSRLASGLYDSMGRQLADWNTLVNTYGLDVYYTRTYDHPYYLTQQEIDNDSWYASVGATEPGYYRFNYIDENTTVAIKLDHGEFPASQVFEDNEELQTGTILVLPDSMSKIPSEAFKNCVTLTTVILPSYVNTIGADAFENDENLVNISIPSSVKYIESEAFKGTAVTTVNLDGNIDYGRGVYSNCDNLTTITYSNNPTEIPNGMFEGCDALASVNMPSSITKIGQSAFENCDSLPSIVIPNSVTEIGTYGFANCSNLTSVTLSENLTEIKDNTFSNADALLSISFPSNITKLGRSAFYSCDSLTELTIPGNIQSIGNDAFANCDNLITVTFQEGVQRLETYSFEDCDKLTTVTIPESLGLIGYRSFAACPSLANAYFALTDKWSLKTGSFSYITVEINDEEGVLDNPSRAAEYLHNIRANYNWVYDRRY